MAEPAIAVAAAEATEEAPATGGELRDKLIATAKELSAKKEAANDKGKPPGRGEKPKAEPPKKPDEAKAKLDEKKPEPPAEEGESELRAKRKALAKFSRKLEHREMAVSTREEQLKTHESRAQHEHNVFLKDPLGWLRGRGVNVREVLLSHAREDAEDPKEKELKTLKERTEELAKKQEERDKAEATEKAERERKEREAAANKELEAGLSREWGQVDGTDYPLLSTLSTPEKVAFYGRQVMINHWRKTAKTNEHGELYDGEELAPGEVFAILEAEVRAHEARTKATGKKPEPPDRVRADKTANPETSRETRSARDVTNRTARVRTTADDAPSGKSGLDRDALRKSLIGIAREHVR